MNKKEKWLLTLCALLYIGNAFLFIRSGNWSALIWEVGCALLLFYHRKEVAQLNRFNQNLDSYIDAFEGTYRASVIRDLERREETARQNASRYLKRLGELADENKRLKILNHNLLTHPSKKKHGNNTNRRTVKAGNKGNN